MSAATPSTALVQAHDLARTFDVSAPWLNRVIERKPLWPALPPPVFTLSLPGARSSSSWTTTSASSAH